MQFLEKDATRRAKKTVGKLGTTPVQYRGLRKHTMVATTDGQAQAHTSPVAATFKLHAGCITLLLLKQCRGGGGRQRLPRQRTQTRQGEAWRRPPWRSRPAARPRSCTTHRRGSRYRSPPRSDWSTRGHPRAGAAAGSPCNWRQLQDVEKLSR